MDKVRKKIPPHLREKFDELVKDYEAMESQPIYDPGRWHVRATPLVEVFSVSVHGNQSMFNDKKPCEIYGKIEVVEEGMPIFDLYHRDEQQFESVMLGGTLLLSGQSTSPILPSTNVKLKVLLHDRAQANAQIACGEFSLDFKTEDESEKIKVECVVGEYGFATVIYSTLHSAVIAKVEVKLLKNSDENDLVATEVYGRIIAKFCDNYRYSITDVGKEYLTNPEKDHLVSKLFHKNRSQPIWVEHGSSIELI